MAQDPPPSQPIKAYYKLEFPGAGNGQGRDYYFQTLSVTIGRRPLPPAPRSPSSSAEPTQPQPSVDVHLGALKSVSRLHAKIDYDETLGRFVFLVHGRNGAWVDDVWIAKGGKVPLHQRTKLQIANRTFYFHLPPGTEEETHDSAPVDVMTITPPEGSRSSSPSSESSLPDMKQEYDSETYMAPAASRTASNGQVEKPPYTYAQLCYRALRALNERATLTEICEWIMDNFEWYRLNRTSGWQTSLRHNLSMNNAFVKSARGKDERGKGCFWSLHPNAHVVFENGAGPAKQTRLNPYTPPVGPPRSHFPGSSALSTASTRSTSSTPLPSSNQISAPVPAAEPSSNGSINIPSNVSLPIVIAPLPASAATSTSTTPHLDAPPIVLHAGTLVLNPTIFSHLSQEQLRELEKLGAQQALSILQAYIVEYLKERMRGEKGAKKPKSKSRAKRKDGRADSANLAAAMNVDDDHAQPPTDRAADAAPPPTAASLLAAAPPPGSLPAAPSDPNPQRLGNGLAALAAVAVSAVGK